MAFGSFEGKGSGSHTVSEINMVPLIDVMLVLLVIFIITAPLLAHSIKINMPQVAAEQIEEEPKTVDGHRCRRRAVLGRKAGQYRRPAEPLQVDRRHQAATRDPHPRRPEYPLRDSGQGHGFGAPVGHDAHRLRHHAALGRAGGEAPAAGGAAPAPSAR